MTGDNGHKPELTPAQIEALDTVKDLSPELARAVETEYKRWINPGAGDDNDHQVKTRWTVGELAQTVFPDPKWAVPDLIPEGLTFLAGRPKMGKSWLGLQIAQAVGTGGMVFDTRVIQGNVLYLALEDSPRRLKERLTLQKVPGNAAITFVTDWNPLPDGGLVDLQNEIDLHDYRLVIIDTLSRSLGGRPDQLDLAEMTTIIGNLQRLSQSKGIAIIVIDHHKKPSGVDTDPIDDIMGSTAKAAVADGALGLYRKRGQHGATLKVTGRDLVERELSLEWDVQFCCWQSLGDADEVKENTGKGKVLAAVVSLFNQGQQPTTTKISLAAELDKGNVSKILAELVSEGKVIKDDKKTGREQPYLPVKKGQGGA